MSIGKKVVGSLALATILWAGATAYIGGNTKTYLDNYINKSNKIYANNGMKMSLLSFDKGFLNSKAKVSVDFIDPTMKEELKEVLKLPMTMDYNIENGPLLFQNGLALGASRVNSTVNVNELLADSVNLKEFIKEDIVIDSNMRVDFSNHVTYTANSKQIVANVEGDVFTIAPFKMNGQMNMETFIGNFKMLSESIKGDLENGGKVMLKDIVVDADITKFFDNGFYLGNFAFAINSLNVKNPSSPIEFKNSTVNMLMNIDQSESETVDMDFAMNINVGDTELPAEYAFVKALNVNYGIAGAKLKGLLAFQDTIQEIQVEQQAVLQKLSSVKTQEEQMLVFEELQKVQMHQQEKMLLLFADFLVKEKTTLKVEASLTDKSDTNSNATFDIKYVGDEVLPKTLEELETKFQEELLNWVKLNINVDLQKSLVDKLPEETQQQLAMAMMTGMLQDNNSSYSFNANYVPKKLMVNGQDKSDMLMLVEMALQGGMQ